MLRLVEYEYGVRMLSVSDTGIAVDTPEDLERTLAMLPTLNSRPRKTLGWETPAERPSKLLATTH